MAKHQEMTVHFKRNTVTDVMFIDLCAVQPGDRVEVLDVGELLGFAGQVQVRVNREKEIVYGLTIQNYCAFRRKLLYRYGVWSIHRAIQLLVSTLLVGLGIDRTTQRPALTV